LWSWLRKRPGSFEDDNFVWTGTGFIEPTVSLSDPNREQTRASDEFFAGVALAAAAAALIALIQEFSDGTRRHRPAAVLAEGVRPVPDGSAAQRSVATVDDAATDIPDGQDPEVHQAPMSPGEERAGPAEE